ncbi:MAG: hypothetical protein PHW63_09315 [Alphaproteobacteria bacterium]|nr:hypothetical protein [Alphaproteobacteria bacterium]
MFEDPGIPTFLGLCAEEWHAIALGLKEGLMPWKRQPRKYGDFAQQLALPDTEKELSPEILKDCMEKYHYYVTAFSLPEDIVFLSTIAWLLVSHFDVVSRLATNFFGITV